VFTAPFWLNVVTPDALNLNVPDDFNEWGDYLTGFLSAPALAWFVATLFLQKRELANQRIELRLQRLELERHRQEMVEARSVWERQAGEQQKLVLAENQALELRARTTFLEQEILLNKVLPQALEDFGSKAATRFGSPVPDDVVHFRTARSFVDGLEEVVKCTGRSVLPDDDLDYFMNLFDTHKENADRFGMQSSIVGRFERLFVYLMWSRDK
jgi:hypothetical protein